jgi:thymidylate synthase
MIDEELYLLRDDLYRNGKVFISKRWQGQEDPPAFLELYQVTFHALMYDDIKMGANKLEINKEWCYEHFAERVSGVPYNPPPSHVKWNTKTEEYLMDDVFSHTYPERLWPKDLGMSGVRFDIADLNTAINVLKNDPETRQCFVPIWFPEDGEASLKGERVPCTIGWQFLLRDNKLHCLYFIRSMDAVRHAHHDIWFCNAMTQYMINKASLDVEVGYLSMSVGSFHCFENDRYTLNKLLEGKL